jgi:hypothetical protein
MSAEQIASVVSSATSVASIDFGALVMDIVLVTLLQLIHH